MLGNANTKYDVLIRIRVLNVTRNDITVLSPVHTGDCRKINILYYTNFMTYLKMNWQMPSRTSIYPNWTTIHTGDCRKIQRLSPKPATKTRDCRRIRRQSPFSATNAEIGDCSLQCGQAISPVHTVDYSRNRRLSPKPATIVSSVDRLLYATCLPT